MKILIIGNPIASGGNAADKMDQLASILKEQGHTPVTYLTKFAHDGKAHVAKVGDDIDRIVVVGGDGTFNEIINGIPDNCSIPLLHLPTGNANLLAHDLDLPGTAEGAAYLIDHGRIIMSDVAVMNNIKFIMVAGAGFDAHVTEEVKKHRTGRLSNLSYVMPILKSLKKAAGSSFKVTIDNKTYHGAMVLVSNVKCYAGICKIAFEAGIDTRVLDIIVFPGTGFFSVVKYFLYARFSKITRLKNVMYLKGRSIKITSDRPVAMELDGDFKGRHREVNIEILQKSIPLIVKK